MRLLLDTHIWLWSLLDPAQLTKKAAKVIEDPSTELWLSPVSLWELLMLVEKGRVRLESDPVKWIRRVLKRIPFKEAPLNYQVVLQSALLDLAHSDPADRFIGATALVYDLTLVTADERLLKSEMIPLLPNR